MADGSPGRHRSDIGTRPCLVEVLHAEELPVGPLFYHTVRTTLLIRSPGHPDVVRNVEQAIPWQAPPPRQGRKRRLNCDPSAIDSSLVLP